MYSEYLNSLDFESKKEYIPKKNLEENEKFWHENGNIFIVFFENIICLYGSDLIICE